MLLRRLCSAMCVRSALAVAAAPRPASPSVFGGVGAGVVTARRGWASTPPLLSGDGVGASGEAPPQPLSPAEAEAALLEELDLLTSAPLPIGMLFKSLSADSRKTLGTFKLPLETFLLKHPKRFAVFKETGHDMIMASRVEVQPETGVCKGRERKAEHLFQGAMSAEQHGIYTVLKYIPNEWSPFVNLGVPDDVKVRCMGRKPKAFLEKHSRYFEVKKQGLTSHTFEVRRSQALQKYMASQEAQQQQQR